MSRGAAGPPDVWGIVVPSESSIWRRERPIFQSPCCRSVPVSATSSDRVRLVRGDATNTPFSDASFDAVTMAFGIRNTPDAKATLDEIHRLLGPAGTAVVLEFSLPANPVMRSGYLAYLRFVIPVIGALVSRDRGAYRYLNRSIEAFHGPAAFCAMMEQAGFRDVSAAPLTGGVASIYKGSKAPSDGGDL